MHKLINTLILWIISVGSVILGIWGITSWQRRSVTVVFGGIFVAVIAVFYWRYYDRMCEAVSHWLDRTILRWFVFWTVAPVMASCFYMSNWMQSRESAYALYADAPRAEQDALYAKYIAINGEMLWTNIFLFVVPVFVMIVVVRLTLLVLLAHATRSGSR
jgi:hypothetical protein